MTKVKAKWICTDPDNQQYGRKISDRVFEFKEKDVQFEVNLDDYSTEDIESHVSSYYGSLEKLREICGEESNWIIAECIFEQESDIY